MKISFAVICHELNNSLRYLVDVLSRNKSYEIFLHVDSKCNIQEFLFLKKRNVHLIENRVDIKWGSFSQIQATLNCMLEIKKTDFQYFFLLSGQDIPLFLNNELDIFVNNNKEKNFINFQGVDDTYVDPVSRVKYCYPDFYFSRNKNLLQKLRCKIFDMYLKKFYLNEVYTKNNKNGVKLMKGSNWVSFNRNTFLAVLDYINNNSDYVSMFNNSFCGDEVFFHSIVMQIPNCEIYTNDNISCPSLRYIDWKSGPDYPKILNNEDKPKILESGCFFARKMDPHLTISELYEFAGGKKYE